MILLYLFFAFILGILLSLLVNFLADILPVAEEDLLQRFTFTPICSQCHLPLSWLNFFLLRPCHYCGQKKNLRHWIIALGLPWISLLVFIFPAQTLSGWWMVGLSAYFAVVMVIDIQERIILRSLTILGWVLTFTAGFILHGLPLTLLGGACGLISMLILYFAGVLFKKSMEKRRGEAVEDALGFGDVYIALMAGFILGFPNVFAGILIAILIGGLVSLVYLGSMWARKTYNAFTPIPYAPFILLATLVMMYKN